MNDIALAILTIGFFFLAEYTWHNFSAQFPKGEAEPGKWIFLYLIGAIISLIFLIF